MSDKPDYESLEASFSAKEAELEATKKDLADLTARIAGLAGAEEPEGEGFDAKSVVASLETKYAEMAKTVEEIKAAAVEQSADAFRDELFRTKEVSAELADELRKDFIASPELTQKVANALPARILKPGESQAAGNVPTVSDKEAEAFDKLIKGAF